MQHRERADDSLRCSFCHKAQGQVKQLLSSPSDYPRVYICDECVGICAAILEDDRAPEKSRADFREPNPLLSHPLISEFMDSVTAWITQETLGRPASEEIGRVRGLASRMLSL